MASWGDFRGMLFLCDSSEKEEVLLIGEDAPDSSEPLSRPVRSSLSFDLSRCKIARARALFDRLCLVWRVESVRWPRRRGSFKYGGKRESKFERNRDRSSSESRHLQDQLIENKVTLNLQGAVHEGIYQSRGTYPSPLSVISLSSLNEAPR